VAPADASAARWLSADPWLAAAFGRPAFRLAPPAAAGRALAAAELRAATREPAFIYAKVDVGDIATAQWLEDQGFRLTDSNLLLEKTDFAAPGATPAGVRPGRPDDRAQVVALAGSSFRYSRFHADPHIPSVLADRIKAQWVDSHYRGQRGDLMLVAEAAGVIVGFLLALGTRAGDPIIDLIAVAPAARGQGVARRLSLLLETTCPGRARARVGTQLANTPALALYQSLGYRVRACQHVFHLHGGPAPTAIPEPLQEPR
jgi:ribosomal protein S18 acetylase RimI-like enzyme